jgi:predicted nucleotidyltransferase
MEDFSALSEGERALLLALNRHGVRFMLVGLSAAVLQGANTATRDIDIWFEDIADRKIGDAVREANGILVPGSFGMRPLQLGRRSARRSPRCCRPHARLRSFAEELAASRELEVDGIPLRVLSLERIIVSKRAANRARDLAAIPALEEALAALSEQSEESER